MGEVDIAENDHRANINPWQKALKEHFKWFTIKVLNSAGSQIAFWESPGAINVCTLLVFLVGYWPHIESEKQTSSS